MLINQKYDHSKYGDLYYRLRVPIDCITSTHMLKYMQNNTVNFARATGLKKDISIKSLLFKIFYRNYILSPMAQGSPCQFYQLSSSANNGKDSYYGLFCERKLTTTQVVDVHHLVNLMYTVIGLTDQI